MFALLLYPIRLLLFALQYWTIPTLLVAGVAVAVPAAFLLTGGPTKLTAAEYRQWCADQSTVLVETIVEDTSWPAIEQQFGRLADAGDGVQPPEQFADEHAGFVEAARILSDLPTEIRSLLIPALWFVDGLVELADVLTPDDLRQEILRQMLQTGFLESEFTLTMNGTCGVDWGAVRQPSQTATPSEGSASHEETEQPQKQIGSAQTVQSDTSSQSEQEDAQGSGDEAEARTSPSERDRGDEDSQSVQESNAGSTQPERDTADQDAMTKSDDPDTESGDSGPSISASTSDNDLPQCQEETVDLGLVSESIQVEGGFVHCDGSQIRHYVFVLERSGDLSVTLQSRYLYADMPLWKLSVDGGSWEQIAFSAISGCCDASIQRQLDVGKYGVSISRLFSDGEGHYSLNIHFDSSSVSADQFLGNQGGSINHDFGRTMPQLAASLTDRQREVHLGRWFHQRLFQFSDEEVERDAYWGLIGYNFYNSNWPSSVCRDENGDPFNYGWDSQPYEATPDGRGDTPDWRTRSWHSVFSVVHGHVAYVDEQLGDIAIFDGRNTVYYKHLNEVSREIVPDGLIDDETGLADQGSWVEVFPGDYLGRMGMRGTAIAPHLTIEVRAGPPPHDLCPEEGTATSTLPYLYRLLGGR